MLIASCFALCKHRSKRTFFQWIIAEYAPFRDARSVHLLLLSDVSGQNIGPIFKVNQSKNNFSWNFSWSVRTLKMGEIVSPETSVTTNLRCITLQKSADFIYTATEA
jgi:hypothetical protein